MVARDESMQRRVFGDTATESRRRPKARRRAIC